MSWVPASMAVLGALPQYYADMFGWREMAQKVATVYSALPLQSHEVAGHIDSPYAMPYETNQPIYVLRNIKTPLQDYWPSVKKYN